MATVDEILTCLADVGLTVWNFHQGESLRWHACLEDTHSDPLTHYSADGDTALLCLLAALAKAGIQVDG